MFDEIGSGLEPENGDLSSQYGKDQPVATQISAMDTALVQAQEVAIPLVEWDQNGDLSSQYPYLKNRDI